jgi:hypothetical protein
VRFAYVPFDEIEDRLQCGWMVCPPTALHPVLDWYRVLMIKLCDCEDADEKLSVSIQIR